MVATIEPPEEHLVLPGIRWSTFERVLEDMGKTRRRIAYQDGILEFTAPAFEHHNINRLIGNLIFFVALETKTPLCSGGSKTLTDSRAKVGIEPDQCFWIKHETQMRGKKGWTAHTCPPPDLAVEIDIFGNALNRLEIYAALSVPEVWQLRGGTLKVLVLGANEKYRERTKSLAFPGLAMDGFARFVKKLGSAEEVSLLQQFTEWLRSEVVGKKAGADRKNRRQ